VGICAVTVTLCPWQALKAAEGAHLTRTGALAAELTPSEGRTEMTAELLKDQLHVPPEVALGTGLVMSALLALGVFSAQGRRNRAPAEEALRQARDELEQRVRERTAELEKANRELLAEISQRPRVEEERDRFFALSRDLLCITGFDGYFKSLNPAWERTLGFTLEELMAKPMLDAIVPEDRAATAAELEGLLSGRETVSFEVRHRTKDGSSRRFLWNAVPLPALEVIYGAARDITELRQAEEALREREEQFRRLFEAAPIGIVLWGLDHRVVRVNKACCEMLGYTEQELAQLTFEKITHPEDLESDLRHMALLGKGEIPSYKLETRYLKKDGRVLWVDLTGTVVRREDGSPLCFLSMVEDVSERKQSQEHVRQLNAELERRIAELTSVNQELEAFAYSVSHDLRAPLRHIDGFSKILVEEAGATLDSSARECLEHIRKGSKQMGRMVDELLNLARIVSPEASRELTDLGALVEEVLSDLKPEMEGREIKLEIGELPFLDCDPVLMKQVLTNLFSNALKFTRPRPRAVIQVGQIRQAGQAVVFVRDNGVGFSMKYADKLFGVFQRLHRQEDFEGTGIGLATVQRIIHKHGGQVWAEAELDRGATFFFTLDPKEGQPARDKIIAKARG
jgi:PAS domain S-box-containing protein